MKEDIIIPITKVEDFVAANMRRDKYALTRDVQALEFNQAIVTRQASEARNLVKCNKCGEEFAAGSSIIDSLSCPKCKSAK